MKEPKTPPAEAVPAYAIFDMDGTLLDSMEYWRKVPFEFLASLHDPRLDTAYLKTLAGIRGTRKIALRLKQDFGLVFEPEKTDDLIYRLMGRHYENDILPYANIVDRLRALSEGGAKIALLTATRHLEADAAIRRFGLDRYFDAVLTHEDNGGVGKEDPSMFRLTLARLGCGNPADCTLFEDSLYSIRVAKSLGMRIVAVLDRMAAEQREEITALSDETVLPIRDANDSASDRAE